MLEMRLEMSPARDETSQEMQGLGIFTAATRTKRVVSRASAGRGSWVRLRPATPDPAQHQGDARGDDADD
jgi:hypothetical protein